MLHPPVPQPLEVWGGSTFSFFSSYNLGEPLSCSHFYYLIIIFYHHEDIALPLTRGGHADYRFHRASYHGNVPGNTWAMNCPNHGRSGTPTFMRGGGGCLVASQVLKGCTRTLWVHQPGHGDSDCCSWIWGKGQSLNSHNNPGRRPLIRRLDDYGVTHGTSTPPTE